MAAVVGEVLPRALDPSYRTSTVTRAVSYQPVDTVTARVTAVLVWSTAIVCGTAAIVGVDAPASLRTVVPVVGVLAA